MTERTDQLQRDKAAVEEVNTEFYGAFERGDLDSMTRIWLDDRETLCVHPGTTPLRGASAITRSWALLKGVGFTLSFFLYMGGEILWLRRSLKREPHKG